MGVGRGTVSVDFVFNLLGVQEGERRLCYLLLRGIFVVRVVADAHSTKADTDIDPSGSSTAPSRNTITPSDVSAAVAKANKALSPLDLAIRSARSQRDTGSTSSSTSTTTNNIVYALVMLSTVDPLIPSQVATQQHSGMQSQSAVPGGSSGAAAWPSPTTYTPDEQAFVRRVLDAIFESNNTPRAEVLAVKGMQAVRLHRAPQQQQQHRNNDNDSGNGNGGGDGGGNQQQHENNEWQNRPAQSITMGQAEKILARLVDEGWLERSRAGWYTLGVRGLIELREWLVETYNGGDDDHDDDDDDGNNENGNDGNGSGKRQKWERIKFCDACGEIITIVSSAANKIPFQSCLLYIFIHLSPLLDHTCTPFPLNRVSTIVFPNSCCPPANSNARCSLHRANAVPNAPVSRACTMPAPARSFVRCRPARAHAAERSGRGGILWVSGRLVLRGRRFRSETSRFLGVEWAFTFNYFQLLSITFN